MAVSIFAIAMGLAYSGLDAAVRARGQLAASSERFGRIQLVLGMLDRDVRTALPRPTRDEFGEPQPAFVMAPGGFAVTAARGSQSLARPGPDVDRVRWSWQDDAWVRVRLTELQPGAGQVQGSTIELDGVRELRIEALSPAGAWHPRWPPQGGPPDAWPRALRWRAEIDGLGEVERLIELPREVAL